MVNEERLLETFLALVRIDSPSGEEGAVADELEGRLAQLGLEVERDDSNNLTARLPGDGESLILAAHMDTVMPGHGVKPVVRDGTVYSDGTTILGADDKSGVAVILEVLEVLAERELDHGPLEVVLTVQEEVGLVGISRLDKSRLRSRLGISFDTGPEPGNIVVAAPSHDLVSVTVHGKAAHSGSQPEKGINALLVAAEALTEIPLGRIDEETTANFGQIEGGRARNIVPDRVELLGEARSHSLEKLEAQTKRMEQGFQSAAQRHGATADVQVERAYNSYKFTEEEPVVARLMRACRAAGVEPNLVPSGGGSDVNVLNAGGIRVVNLSTGMCDVHSTDEHIAVTDMVTCAEIALQFVTDAVAN
jgi:tripeptide aminopeptidase